MSNAALKQVTTAKASKSKAPDLAHILMSPQTIAQIKAALPRHMQPDRMARVALTETRKNPKLAQCDARTFLGAVIQLSQLGLEPGGALGHAFLIPFENRKKGTVDVQLIVGYRGMIDLARRSGQIATMDARVVREGDAFECQFGDSPRLHHVPNFDDDKPMTHAYFVVVFKDGSKQFDVMSRGQIEKIRNKSQGYIRGKEGGDTPWITHPEEMAKKTVVRRLFKYLPVSIELQRAVMLDERGDAGLTQAVDDAGAIDSTATEIDEGAKQLEHEPDGHTYAEVASWIDAATSADTLDVAAGMIETVADAKQQEELTALAKAKRESLTKGEGNA